MTKRFDRDGDGQLSDTERQAARDAMKKLRDEHRARSRERGGPGDFRGPPEGGEPPLWMRQELRRWFDEKWGGHPGRGPHPAMGGPGRKLHDEIVKRFDHDGDGKLNEVERAEARKAGDELRARFKQHREEILARFDKNGDGQLDETERQDLRAAWEKFIQQQPVLKPAGK